MICLRFTSTKNEKNFKSEDHVNGGFFKGLCCYDITQAVEELVNNDYTAEEAYEICARKQAEFDNWHAHNTNGQYVIFDGSFSEYDRDNQDRFGERAIIASLQSYLAHGLIEQANYGYKCISLELV